MKGICAWAIHLGRTYTWGLFRLKLQTWGGSDERGLVSWDKNSSEPEIIWA